MSFGRDIANGLEPADIIVVRGKGWLSDRIRALTRSPGESKGWASHVAISTGGGYIIEALPEGVVSRRMPYTLGTRCQVFRPLNLTATDKRLIVRHACGLIGSRYGWSKIALHGIDGVLSKLGGLLGFKVPPGGYYVARRLAFIEGRPMCSWTVAVSYEAAGYTFGVAAKRVSPDDIHDFVTKHHDKYTRVWR